MLAVRPGWSDARPGGRRLVPRAAHGRGAPPAASTMPLASATSQARVGDAHVGRPGGARQQHARSWPARADRGRVARGPGHARRWRRRVAAAARCRRARRRSPGSSDRRSSEWSRVTGLMARMVAASPGAKPRRAWSSGPMSPCVTTSIRPRPASRSADLVDELAGVRPVAGHGGVGQQAGQRLVAAHARDLLGDVGLDGEVAAMRRDDGHERRRPRRRRGGSGGRRR